MPIASRKVGLILLISATPLLGGCLARTAFDVATAPVRVASKAVDLATTSQSESDEKRGRELRKREERLGKLERRYFERMEDCEDGNDGACDDAREAYEEIALLRPTIPAPLPDYDR